MAVRLGHQGLIVRSHSHAPSRMPGNARCGSCARATPLQPVASTSQAFLPKPQDKSPLLHLACGPSPGLNDPCPVQRPGRPHFRWRPGKRYSRKRAWDHPGEESPESLP